MAEYVNVGMQSPFGAFTGGLFGGMRNTMELANAWEELKGRRLETQRQQDQMDAANAVKGAMNTGNGSTNTTLPSVTDTGAAPAATGNSGRDANGRPDLSTVPRPKFMQTPIGVSNNVPLPARKPTPPATQAEVSSFERGSRESAAAPASTAAAATPAAATPQAQDPTAAALGETAAAPFRAVGRGLAAVGRGALDLGSKVGQGMATGESYGMIPPANYLPPGSQGAAATVPTAPARPAIGQPTQALPVPAPTQPQAAAPPGAAPSLSQSQTPSLNQQILNAIQAGGSGF